MSNFGSDFDFDLSLVKAPACKECGKPLEAYGAFMWICKNSCCIASGIARSVSGVYPAQVFPPKPAAHVDIDVEADTDNGED